MLRRERTEAPSLGAAREIVPQRDESLDRASRLRMGPKGAAERACFLYSPPRASSTACTRSIPRDVPTHVDVTPLIG